LIDIDSVEFSVAQLQAHSILFGHQALLTLQSQRGVVIMPAAEPSYILIGLPIFTTCYHAINAV